MTDSYIPLPEGFVRRIRASMPQESEELLAALDGPRSWGIRINPLRNHARESLNLLGGELTPIPWCCNGSYYDGSVFHPGRNALHDAGVYYLQDPSAMAVAEVLDVHPGQLVLDLCAAPGGKSTAIAAKLNGDGLLVANEIVRSRAALLSANLERWGAGNVMILSENPRNITDTWGACFDRVLVDAPCSGEGMFRKDPAARLQWSEASADACSDRQKLILESATSLVRPGGRLVYSTCTFSPAENEEIARWFLDTHSDYEACSIDLPGWRPGIGGEGYCRRMGPHIGRGEGHFVAAFLRTAGDEDDIPVKRLPRCKDSSAWDAFCKEIGPVHLRGQLAALKDQFHLYPEILPDTGKLYCLRAGIPLGRAGKGYFVPHHSLAMTGLIPQIHELSMNSEDIDNYLAGEVIPCGEKGWMVVSLCGSPLGWGKAGQGQMKNHLPTGLRRRGRKFYEEEES